MCKIAICDLCLVFSCTVTNDQSPQTMAQPSPMKTPTTARFKSQLQNRYSNADREVNNNRKNDFVYGDY